MPRRLHKTVAAVFTETPEEKKEEEEEEEPEEEDSSDEDFVEVNSSDGSSSAKAPSPATETPRRSGRVRRAPSTLVSESSDEDEDDEPRKKRKRPEAQTTKKKRKKPKQPKRLRRSYTAAENQAMLDWLERHGSEAAARGNVFKAMAAAGVTTHSWKSMRNHFACKLAPLLQPTGDEDEDATTATTATAATSDEEERRKRTERAETWRDDRQMLSSLQRHASTTSSTASSSAKATPTAMLFDAILRSPAAKALARPRVRVEREAAVRQMVAELAERCGGVPLAVVLHALVVHNGDVGLAERYLRGEDVNVDEEPLSAWTVDEDSAVLSSGSSAAEAAVVARRGADAVGARRRFLAAAAAALPPTGDEDDDDDDSSAPGQRTPATMPSSP